MVENGITYETDDNEYKREYSAETDNRGCLPAVLSLQCSDMPIYIFGTHHGVGVQLLNDAIGLFTHKRVALQYAWQSRMWGGTFSLGAQAGMLSEHFDGSRLDLDDADDPAFTSSSVDGSSVDVGIGAYYRCHDWYVGVSAMHLNSPQVDLGETNELDISPTYYLSGGYNIRLSHPFLFPNKQTQVSSLVHGCCHRFP